MPEQNIPAHLHRMAGAKLLRLVNKDKTRTCRQRRSNIFSTVAHHHSNLVNAGGLQGVEHIIDQRPAKTGHEYFGQVGLHPSAFTSGQHHSKRRRRLGRLARTLGVHRGVSFSRRPVKAGLLARSTPPVTNLVHTTSRHPI